MPTEQTQSLIYFIIGTWSMFWSGIALWKAAKLDQKNWFIVIVVLNPLGLLSIVYLFFFAKKKMTFVELKSGFKSIFMTDKK